MHYSTSPLGSNLDQAIAILWDILWTKNLTVIIGIINVNNLKEDNSDNTNLEGLFNNFSYHSITIIEFNSSSQQNGITDKNIYRLDMYKHKLPISVPCVYNLFLNNSLWSKCWEMFYCWSVLFYFVHNQQLSLEIINLIRYVVIIFCSTLFFLSKPTYQVIFAKSVTLVFVVIIKSCLINTGNQRLTKHKEN